MSNYDVALANTQEFFSYRVQELTESRKEDVASFGWRPWARSLADAWTVRMDVLDEIALAPIRAWRILGQHTPLIH